MHGRERHEFLYLSLVIGAEGFEDFLKKAGIGGGSRNGFFHFQNNGIFLHLFDEVLIALLRQQGLVGL